MHIGAASLHPKGFGGGTAHVETAVQMDAYDSLPIGGLHLVEDDVPQNARVVDHHVKLSEMIHGHFNRAPCRAPFRHALGADDRRATHGLDHRLGLLRRRGGAFARPAQRDADIVDDHFRARASEFERDAAPDPPACARDDRNLVAQPQIHRHRLFLPRSSGQSQ